ncbi:hypothetical protein ERJ75_001638900 [Trypanosoma vivax]|nr:hypothetical protein ERJ75_001638900 [Trypanosoma vivax]
MLRLLNYGLRTEQVPAKWRHGIIVPLLKPNGPANSTASFRLVVLKSALCTLKGRNIVRGDRDCIEDKLQPQRPGFKPVQSILGTIVQVTSAVRRRMGWRENGGCAH